VRCVARRKSLPDSIMEQREATIICREPPLLARAFTGPRAGGCGGRVRVRDRRGYAGLDSLNATTDSQLPIRVIQFSDGNLYGKRVAVPAQYDPPGDSLLQPIHHTFWRAGIRAPSRRGDAGFTELLHGTSHRRAPGQSPHTPTRFPKTMDDREHIVRLERKKSGRSRSCRRRTATFGAHPATSGTSHFGVAFAVREQSGARGLVADGTKEANPATSVIQTSIGYALSRYPEGRGLAAQRGFSDHCHYHRHASAMRNLLFRSKIDSSPAEAVRSDNALTVPGISRVGSKDRPGHLPLRVCGEPQRRTFSAPLWAFGPSTPEKQVHGFTNCWRIDL
jgi:hypothetical protein